MQRRTAVTELFSTFIQFSEGHFDRWMSDWRLQKEMQQLLSRGENSSLSEELWTLYWYKRWHEDAHKQAASHLNAYLQEPCYWAAQSITQRFSSVQWSLADGFQVAIAQTERILKGYRPDYGSNLRLYARTAFSNLIQDQLRQQQDINICSDWGLLRRLSQAQLKHSLLAAGLTQIESSILAWQCFKAVYIPNPQRLVRALPPPTPEQYAQITSRYNQLRLQRQPGLPPRATDELANLLQQSVQAARAYLTPATTSLDRLQLDQDILRAQLNDLSTSSDNTPMNQLLAAEAYGEQQQRLQQIRERLTGAIATLTPDEHTLLRLYYQEARTQAAIAQELQIKQYQVSRRLSRVRQQLLLNLAQWSQETLHISINSTVLGSMSNVIHEWLQQHYQSKAENFNELGV